MLTRSTSLTRPHVSVRPTGVLTTQNGPALSFFCSFSLFSSPSKSNGTKLAFDFLGFALGRPDGIGVRGLDSGWYVGIMISC